MAIPFNVGAWLAVDMCVGSVVKGLMEWQDRRNAQLMVPCIASGMMAGARGFLIEFMYCIMCYFYQLMVPCIASSMMAGGWVSLNARTYAYIPCHVLCIIFHYIISCHITSLIPPDLQTLKV